MQVSPSFPFCALQGQRELQTALLLCLIDPQIGGLLIEGPPGTGKTTSARALAELLPEGQLVNLPLGASEEQLVGSLNLEAVLQHNSVNFQPGLLAKAHQGILYVDEVNLLADHLVDLLLDASASGVNRVERDGISHQHEARFVLIGTMNPEEGQLRPQLLDRFGLYLQLDAHPSAETRQQILRQRLDFDTDPYAFQQRYEQQQQAMRQRVLRARQQLTALQYSDALIQTASELCTTAQATGMRADLTLLRAARAHAAWQEQTQIEITDIQAVQAWVLAHRSHSDTEFEPQTTAKQPTDQPLSRPPATNNSAIATDLASNQQTQTTSSRPHAEEPDWGALPAEAPSPPIAQVKQVRPLTVKKP